MVAKVTETCRWLIIYLKVYFTSVRCLIHYASVSILQCTDVKHIMSVKCRGNFCPAVDSADVTAVRYVLPLSLLFCFGHFVFNIVLLVPCLW